MMLEVPAAAVAIDAMLPVVDFVSIGSNDLVQTVYAVSRDDLEGYRHPVDARSSAVQTMIRQAVQDFRARGLEIGISSG